MVNRQTAPQVERIYRFYQRSRLGYLQFIPSWTPWGRPRENRTTPSPPKEYGRFLCRLFDLWYQDAVEQRAPSIRQFENYIEMLLGFPPEACGMAGVCGMQHVVEADGSVYPCDFYVLDGYRLGNLCTDSLEEINRRREALGFVQQSRAVDRACRDCPHFPLCRGGCRRYRPVEADGSLGRRTPCARGTGSSSPTRPPPEGAGPAGRPGPGRSVPQTITDTERDAQKGRPLFLLALPGTLCIITQFWHEK